MDIFGFSITRNRTSASQVTQDYPGGRDWRNPYREQPVSSGYADSQDRPDWARGAYCFTGEYAGRHTPECGGRWL